LPDDFIWRFNEANATGLENMDKVIVENQNAVYDLNVYYKKNISYKLTKEKLEGMSKFLELLKED